MADLRLVHASVHFHAAGLGPGENLGYQTVENAIERVSLQAGFRSLLSDLQYGSPSSCNFGSGSKMFRWFTLGFVEASNDSFHGHIDGGICGCCAGSCLAGRALSSRRR